MRIKLPPAKLQVIFWSVTGVGIALDLLTKKVVFDWLSQKPPTYTVPVIDGFLNLVMALNPGAAFGIASRYTWFLVSISILALAGVLIFFLFSGNRHKIAYLVLGLFAAGVCGNLYDRIFNGGLVRDFIDVYIGRYHWPAFNVADSMLCVAVGLILLNTFGVFSPEKSGQKRAQQRK
jgi:signal peptidase II